jgi:hypothetical protein
MYNFGAILLCRRFWGRVRQGHRRRVEAECTSLPLVRSFKRLLEEPEVAPLVRANT